MDEALDEWHSGMQIRDLVPTLGSGLQEVVERKIVWERILPVEDTVAICPVLMCPDDCDFSCSLIVAEIINTDTVVQWKRIGFDQTKELGADNVGTSVKWFRGFKGFNFNKTDYLKMIADFQTQLKIEEL